MNRSVKKDMNIKKGIRLMGAGVTGIFLAILLLCVGVVVAIFISLFWIFLFSVIGLGSYGLIPGAILGVICTIGLMWGWLSNQIEKEE